MHPNPIFRGTQAGQSLNFARQRGFGTLTLNGPTHPLLAHIPFLINDDATELELHVMRSNPIWQALDADKPAILAVTGPDGYISPDWYEVPDQVPTWNYVAVHLHGTLRRIPHADLSGVLDRLTEHFEAHLAPKTPWHSSKMSDGVMDRMMRMIVPCRMTITDLHSTWKLNQNKPDEVRLRASAQIQTGTGSELAALAALMQAPPNPTE
jgi:transcriptional regulator